MTALKAAFSAVIVSAEQSVAKLVPVSLWWPAAEAQRGCS
jgi:hypothetical protein